MRVSYILLIKFVKHFILERTLNFQFFTHELYNRTATQRKEFRIVLHFFLLNLILFVKFPKSLDNRLSKMYIPSYVTTLMYTIAYRSVMIQAMIPKH